LLGKYLNTMQHHIVFNIAKARAAVRIRTPVTVAVVRQAETRFVNESWLVLRLIIIAVIYFHAII